jgi:hypothetical protein
MRGPLPLSLSAAQIAEIETLAAVLNAEQIADYFGIGRTTFFAMIRRDAEIGERYKKGKARAVGSIAQTLIQKARAGDTASMIFYLKTQGGWRETLQVERHDEWSREALDLKQLSDEDLLRMMGVLQPLIEREGLAGTPGDTIPAEVPT